MNYILKVKPAIDPKNRHIIEDTLKDLGYDVLGGGTTTDKLTSDISFKDDQESNV